MLIYEPVVVEEDRHCSKDIRGVTQYPRKLVTLISNGESSSSSVHILMAHHIFTLKAKMPGFQLSDQTMFWRDLGRALILHISLMMMMTSFGEMAEDARFHRCFCDRYIQRRAMDSALTVAIATGALLGDAAACTCQRAATRLIFRSPCTPDHHPAPLHMPPAVGKRRTSR